MMPSDSHCRAALDARVSSDQQAEAGTIDSQVAVLQERMRQDGVPVDPELCFLDDGYTGSTLVRPALERLGGKAEQESLQGCWKRQGAPLVAARCGEVFGPEARRTLGSPDTLGMHSTLRAAALLGPLAVPAHLSRSAAPRRRSDILR